MKIMHSSVRAALRCHTGRPPAGRDPGVTWPAVSIPASRAAAQSQLHRLRSACPDGLRFTTLKRVLHAFEEAGGPSYGTLGIFGGS